MNRGSAVVLAALVALAGLVLLPRRAPVGAAPAGAPNRHWLLLAVVLYHGLNGVRTITHDYLGVLGAQRVVDWWLWIGGLALFIYGSWGLAAFVR